MTSPTTGVRQALCPCGKPARVKYCSRTCAGRYTRGVRPPATHCRRCGRPMTGDNRYSDREDRRARCRHCVLANGRPGYEPLPRGQRGNQHTAATPATAPAARPTRAAPTVAPAAPARPVWRPASWTTTGDAR